MRWTKAVPWVAALVLAGIAAGSAWSQGTPPDLTVDETKHQRPAFPSLKDFGSFGFSAGLMKVFGGDLGSSSKTRPIMQGDFRYRFSDDWIGLGNFGFGWNSFEAQGDTVLTFSFGTLGVARRVATHYLTDFRVMAGGGAYRWNYKYHGYSLRDRYPIENPDGSTSYGGSQLLYKGMDPGGYLGFEGERRIARHVTLTGTLQQHFVFTADSKYDRNFDTNYSFLSFRIGANYHFSPTEGIMWERKASNTIRLESGKEGK
jgi:hypothetical protein